MTLRRPPPARAAFALYRGLPRSTRAHLAVRWLTCPLPAVAAEVPPRGTVLDIGCGHGFLAHYLAADGPGRTVHGVDVDAAKISEARRATEAGPPPGLAAPTFEVVEAGWRPGHDQAWTGVVLVDVLYLLGRAAALDLLAAAAGAVAPGGRIVVKEIDTHPRWKHRLTILQELAATRVAKVTAGPTVAFVDPGAMTEVLAGAGLAVRRRPIGRGYPHPHLLLVGERPT